MIKVIKQTKINRLLDTYKAKLKQAEIQKILAEERIVMLRLMITDIETVQLIKELK